MSIAGQSRGDALRGVPVRAQDGDAPGEPVACEVSGEKLHEHRRGLWLVGLYKLAKTVFFTLLGAGALRLVHANLGDMAMRLVDWMHLDSEGRVAGFLMDRADLIGHHQLRQSALFAFLYAALCATEGTGLMLEKRWAEYLTATLTAAALPWEGYELVQRFAWYKVVLTLLNVGVLLYVLWVLKQKGLFGRAGERAT